MSKRTIPCSTGPVHLQGRPSGSPAAPEHTCVPALAPHQRANALPRTSGVISRAAELLHLRRTTLTEKIRKYGIVPDSQ